MHGRQSAKSFTRQGDLPVPRVREQGLGEARLPVSGGRGPLAVVDTGREVNGANPGNALVTRMRRDRRDGDHSPSLPGGRGPLPPLGVSGPPTT